MLTDGREYALSATAEAAWEKANEIRQAARKALMSLDAKGRLSLAELARPQRLEFDEGEPVLAW